MNDISTSNELVVIEPADALKIFTEPKAIDPLLQRIRKEIDSFSADVETASGRKEIASMARKVARAKVYLDDAGKELVARYKEIPKKIDATRKEMRDTLDNWRDEVRAPLDAYKAKESERVEAHKTAITEISALASTDGLDAATLRERLAKAESVSLETAEEFVSEYALAKEQAINALKAALPVREKYEADQAELERFRREAAIAEQVDREDRIAREAAERAKAEAEAKAVAERQAIETAALREKEAAEKRELELRLAAEQAERRAAEAEAKAKREAEEAKAREAEETARRKANKAHRAKINRTALDAFIRNGIDESVAKAVITLIAQREIPNVSINY